jgi:hypothetical protein
MIDLNQVENQLKRVGCNYRFWGRPEIRELQNILVPGEIIAQAANGRYENGFALLVVTNHRLLLVDKKPMFLTLEDIRFDMIAEVDYNSQLLDGTIRVITPNRVLNFTGWNHGRMRAILNYTERRITEIRQHYIQQQFLIAGRDDEYTAPTVGSLALQGTDRADRSNPYTNIPLTVRRRRFPRFY